MTFTPLDAQAPAAPANSPPTAPWRRRLLIGVAIAVGTAVAVLVLLRVRTRPSPPAPERMVAVRARPPAVRDLPIKLSSTAEVRPIQLAEIRPVEAKGVIRSIFVDRGDRVRRGRLLVVVDCPEFRDQVRQAEARVTELVASSRNAERVHRRLKPMRAQRFISQMELDNARAAMESARARVQSARARVAKVRQRLAYCRMRAPFSGEVLARHRDPGALVRPGGRSILTLMRIDRVRVWTPVAERDVTWVKLRLPVTLTVPALSDRRFHGKVTRFVKGLDRRTRTVLVETEFPNPGGIIRPGMFGRVELVVSRRLRALVVPASAVLAQECVDRDRQTCTWVYVVRGERAHRVEVQVGYALGSEVEIQKGLQPGDLVIHEGRDLVADRTLVRLLGDR